MPLLTGNPVTRTVLLYQLSARPWALPADLALQQMRSFAECTSFDEVLHDLVHGPRQEGAPAASTGPVAIGCGRKDRLTPRKARRAAELFPDARVEWFDGSGHFPHWDRPEAAMCLILAATG